MVDHTGHDGHGDFRHFAVSPPNPSDWLPGWQDDCVEQVRRRLAAQPLAMDDAERYGQTLMTAEAELCDCCLTGEALDAAYIALQSEWQTRHIEAAMGGER